ncbi:Conserved_hypothetical protein [Hexamita inflata]|uniref:Uncharacterized protein n=1 Tax=Hexamita inflata TaxID=28002 RepID=A0AA86V445_9EUKA|nr:Conserved hypothetical protein [Hexamita inflata]
MIAFMLSLSELTRAQKKTMYNCFTTSADINLFADTLQITVTLTSTKSASCDIPHGVFVSLQIDSLGSYEPSAYVQDFAYDSPQQIRLACTDPVECAKIKAAESGTIVLETKTHATFVPAGSIRVSKGLSSSCFHDNDSFVELYQGAVVLVLYPTFTCKDSIASDNLGQLKLNTLSKVKMYITYTDNSISIHDQLAITIQQDLFVPTLKVTASSTPVRIKLENPTISKYFIQTMTNGVLSKDMILVQANLEYFTNDAVPLKKNSQITMNIYKFTGIDQAFSQLNLQFVSNGFLTQQTIGPLTDAANQLIVSLGVTHYTYYYVFTMYDVEKTSQLWNRVFGNGFGIGTFSDASYHNTCNISYPGQACEQLQQQIKNVKVSDIKAFHVYQFYKNNQPILNYTKMIDNIYGSCFTDGQLIYNSKTRFLEIVFDQNFESQSCSLVKNDALVIVIKIGDFQELKTINIDFIPGRQTFNLSKIDLSHQPEIRVHFLRNGKIQDAIAINKYVLQVNDMLLVKEIIITVKILAVNLSILLFYLFYTKLILVIRKAPVFKVKKSVHFTTVLDEDLNV